MSTYLDVLSYALNGQRGLSHIRGFVGLQTANIVTLHAARRRCIGMFGMTVEETEKDNWNLKRDELKRCGACGPPNNPNPEIAGAVAYLLTCLRPTVQMMARGGSCMEHCHALRCNQAHSQKLQIFPVENVERIVIVFVFAFQQGSSSGAFCIQIMCNAQFLQMHVPHDYHAIFRRQPRKHDARLAWRRHVRDTCGFGPNRAPCDQNRDQCRRA